MKAQQLRSSDALGKVSMYGDLFDVDSRSVVSEGIPSLSSLNIIVSALMREQGAQFLIRLSRRLWRQYWYIFNIFLTILL